jgi:nucleotide-binding universal stress UspA family protein
MDRFKDILVAASPGHLEPMTMRAAIMLADTNRARLTVIDVMEPMSRMRRFTTVEGQMVDVQAELMGHREQRLRQLVATTRAGDGIDVKVLVGEPFVEVIRHVLAHGNDLVIVGASEVAKWETPEFSSSEMHLLRKCPVPLWVMRPSQAEQLRILALVDPDAADPVRDSLNGLVLELATSLARREGGELHIGHAWELTGEATLRSSPYVQLPGEVVDVMVDTAEGVHREQLDLLLQRHDIEEIGAEVHLVGGEAGEVLPRLAEGLDAGLIVMGTVARTGISGLIVGNTAETILRSVRCSVLALKPEAFVTPVKPAKTKGRADSVPE